MKETQNTEWKTSWRDDDLRQLNPWERVKSGVKKPQRPAPLL
ncbi:MAG: hypothetical protein FD135_10 [Comamonadaceae bacterium]|nr:MAG: hypothetical protein FD135_10 [Comamonadaceae bacterium]